MRLVTPMQRPRIPFHWRAGTSLVELMIAITILAILARFAYISYRELIPDAKSSRVQHDLRTLADALSTYNRDHPNEPYSSFKLDDLKGRYIDEVPIDPWADDFVVDPVFQRVVSRGPDQKLQTVIPGFEECPSKASEGDDIFCSFGELGYISFISDGYLRRMAPDGTHLEAICGSFAQTDWANQSPDRIRFIISIGGTLSLLERQAEGFIKNTIKLTGGLSGGHDCIWSPDGLKFAFISAPNGAVAVSDVTTGVSPVVVTTPTAGAASPYLTPGNRELVFSDKTGNIFRAAASEESPVTTLNVKTTGEPELDAGRIALSPDGKRIAYINASGSIFLRSITQSGRREIVRGVTKGTGSLEVVYSPNGRNLAFTDGKAIYVASASPPAGTMASAVTVLDGYGWIKSLSWR